MTQENHTYVRLVQSHDEIEQAQKLRYAVFYEEHGATPTPDIENAKRDFDEYDLISDHLVVIAVNQSSGQEEIVGTYRLLRQDMLEDSKITHSFYSSDEYDLSLIIKSNNKLLELGRSCVLPAYRTKPILNLLWQGIADYISHHEIDLLFGCASFHGTDPDLIKQQLSYLHHFHATDRDICPRGKEKRYINMNIIPKEDLNERRIFASLPPLIKGYLRLGATIGDGAIVDHAFNTIDICIVVETRLMTSRYRNYFERKINKKIPDKHKNKIA